LELDDQVPLLYYLLVGNYNRLYQYDKAIPEGEKALDIYKKWDSKPESVLGQYYVRICIIGKINGVDHRWSDQLTATNRS